jgi:outer membrane receptor protein involved in Fe transport
MRRNFLLRAAVLVATATGLAGAATAVWAQAAKAGAEDGQLEEVVVTGSRIMLPNMVSTSPIEVVTAKDIQVGGKTDITDVIMQLPQNFNNSFTDFNNRTSALSVAGGVANADLRGLGPQRTLVLVNGRRLGVGDANTANPNPAGDLDQIPTALVERLDVVTGGASATYGSDAIAGVVNFIMRRDFQGVEVSGQWGQNWHEQHNSLTQNLERQDGIAPPTGSIRDGNNKSFNLILGSNIADGRGNVTAYLGYLQADPVPSGNRDFGACQLNAATDPTGSFYNGAFCSGSGNQFVPNGSVATTPPAVFNSQPYIYNGRDDLRYTAGFLAHLDINEHAEPYAEFGFMNDRTDQKIAPSALFRGANPLNPLGTGNYSVNCDNPFLSAQEAGALCTPAQLAYVAANPGQPCLFPAGATVSPNCADVLIGRRNVEGGGRESYYEHTNYRAVVGVKGALGDAWHYDAYGQYYYTTFFNVNKQYLNFAAIQNALQVTGTAANPVCISGSPCVPYNIFQDGGVTSAALQYLYLDGSAFGTNSQRIAHADLTGDLGRYGIRSPLAKDGFSINVGYEHRAEQMAFDPDSGEQSGLLSGFGGAASAIHRGFTLKEEFVELGGPLVQDKPGIKSLVIDTGLRFSDYSTSGNVSTGKLEVQYEPVEDLRFRGSYQRATRAPNLLDLYNPTAVNLVASGEDPCAPSAYSGIIAATLAQCLRTLPANATPAQIQAFTAAYNSGSIPQGTGSQLSDLQGGNEHLRAETAQTFNVGVTLGSRWLAGFSGSIDYFQIKLKDGIGAVPPGLLLQQCLKTGEQFFCGEIVRNTANWSLTGATIAGGGYIVQTVTNVGAAQINGVDVQTSYHLALRPGWGALNFALNGAYLLKDATQPYPGGPTYDCAGLFGILCATVNPKWRHTLRTTWVTPKNIELAATWRFIATVSLDNNDSNPLLYGHVFINQNTGGPAYNSFEARYPNFSYLDLSGTWTVHKGLELRAGINNLFDKDPPLATAEITASGANNTFETYDTLGRQVFIAFTAKF